MSSWKDIIFFKKRASAVFTPLRILSVQNSVKALACAGIQVAGGVVLTAYTYENSTYRILPFICSTIAIGGTYNIFKMMLKNTSSAFIETDTIQSTWELASGAITYSVGIYAFSESLKRENKIWIPCLALAASGYYFCVSAIDDWETIFNRSPSLACYQVMLGPALIGCASTFLLCFRNHEESCLYWLPFVLVAASGFKTFFEGSCKLDYGDYELFLIKVIKTFMSSCLLTFSTIVLTVYGLIHNFPLIWTVSTTTVAFFGAFLVYGSLTCIRRYIDMDKKIFHPVVGIIVGPLTFFTACLLIQFVEDVTMEYFILLFLAGSSHFILCKSLYQLYKVNHVPKLRKQTLRLLGPLMTVYSCLGTACIAFRMSWRFCIATAPFIPAGLYATYKGYSGERNNDGQ